MGNFFLTICVKLCSMLDLLLQGGMMKRECSTMRGEYAEFALGFGLWLWSLCVISFVRTAARLVCQRRLNLSALSHRDISFRHR
jgi:hypothetical protein